MATSASLDGGEYGRVATHGGMLRARFLAYQLLHALAFAHAQGRAHGALTPRSALLSDDLWLQLDWPWLRSDSKAPAASGTTRARATPLPTAAAPLSASLPRSVGSYDARPLTLRWAVGVAREEPLPLCEDPVPESGVRATPDARALANNAGGCVPPARSLEVAAPMRSGGSASYPELRNCTYYRMTEYLTNIIQLQFFTQWKKILSSLVHSR